MSEPDPPTERMTHNIAERGAHGGAVRPMVTTDEHGEPTANVQAKIVAVLTSSAGVTVVGALIAAFTGVQLDPPLVAAIIGGSTGLIATLAGYFTQNRTSAN